MKTFACFFYLLSISLLSSAQEFLFPMNRDMNSAIGLQLTGDSTGFHSSMQPYVRPDLDSILSIDSLLAVKLTDSKFYSTWVGRKLRKEHLLQVNSDGLKLAVDPLFNVQAGRDLLNQRNLYVNTRGVRVQGDVSGRFFFYTSFHENQARYAGYIDSLVRRNQVVPGQGKVKFLDKESVDFSMSTGGMAYRPNRHFEFLLAQDKLFIGDGYRSMLLSDNSYPYPFLRANMTFWKFRYSVVYTVLQDLQSIPGQNTGYSKKYATVHYLDFTIGRRNRLSIGVFESVVWAPSASRGYELHYLNPFLFLRPVENSIGSPDNELLGLNLHWKASSRTMLYGQLMLDEFLLNEVRSGHGWWGNKQGGQVGFKTFDVFGIKHLHVQSELNVARPFLYQHRTSAQNYTHYNQPLAHPLGADFTEWVSFVNYRWRNFFAEVRFQYATAGKDTAGLNLGNDVFLSYDSRPQGQDYGYHFYTGLKSTLKGTGFRVNYLVNPKYHFVIEAGIDTRVYTNAQDDQSSRVFYLGFRTALENYYFDF